MTDDSLEKEKARFLEGLPRVGIRDPRVLAAMAKVPREEYVPESLRAYAYVDGALPISESQTISQPSLVAYMTQELRLQPSHRVLEVGTGSGYQTALLAELAGAVFTIELREKLGQLARSRVEPRYPQVRFRLGNGTLGWPEEAPFDRIIVTACAKDPPAPLLDQLKPGGLMVIPLGVERHQQLFLLRKTAWGAERKRLCAVRFVPLVGDDGKGGKRTQRAG